MLDSSGPSTGSINNSKLDTHKLNHAIKLNNKKLNINELNINNNFLKIFYTNARSIRNKFEELFGYLYIHRVDVVCITESWVSETHYKDNIDAYKINGYNLYLYQRSRAGSGVALYVKDTLFTTELTSSKIRKNVESI